MKKRPSYAPVFVGGCTLLTIFGVLCLTVLALLSVSTAVAENKQSQKAAQSVENWYQADLKAQEIFARLQAGEDVSQVETDGELYRFCVPISHNTVLDVVLRKEAHHWQVLRWQEIVTFPESEETLPVWAGTQSKD